MYLVSSFDGSNHYAGRIADKAEKTPRLFLYVELRLVSLVKLII